jgi:uncharacterized protein YuzE
MEQKLIKSTKTAINDLVHLALTGGSRIWVDYDVEADVLYISFGRPQEADNAYQGNDGIIRRKKSGKIIGLTVLITGSQT